MNCRHDITEILLKVALNAIKPNNQPSKMYWCGWNLYSLTTLRNYCGCQEKYVEIPVHIHQNIHSYWKKVLYLIHDGLVDWLMVFNATFNNISVISWRSVLLVEDLIFDINKPLLLFFNFVFSKIEKKNITTVQTFFS
jgi:hypothetical protein